MSYATQWRGRAGSKAIKRDEHWIDESFVPERLQPEYREPWERDEASRVSMLAECGIMDTPPEQAFDDIVRLASQIFETPMALVSLVDGYRQWFKASVGLTVGETPRELSLCAHTIMGSDALVVPDASMDARFAKNPMVVGPPNIRFYAGVPLQLEGGVRVGALCVCDYRPRTLTASQVGMLKVLANQVAVQLELRRKLRQRQQTDALIRDHEAKYRHVVESQSELVCRYDRDLRLTFVNDAYARYFGRSKASLVGLCFLELIPEAFHQHVREGIASLPADGTPAQLEHEVIDAQGRTRWQRWTDRAIPDGRGGIAEYQSFGWDVTDRVTAERRVAASEALLRRLVECAPIGVYVAEASGRCVLANSVVRGLCGLTASEPVGDRWSAAVHAEDAARVHREWLDSVASGRAFESEHRLIGGDGRIRWVRSRAIPFDDQPGQRSYVGVVVDITPQREAGESLRSLNRYLTHANQELVARNEEIVQLAFAMTHDLQTPLATIGGSLSQIESMRATQEPLDRPLQRVRAGVERMTRLLEDLMAYARAGHDRVVLARVDVGEIASAVVHELEPSAQEHGVAMHVDAASLAQKFVLGEASAVRRCLENVLTNAIKFTATVPASRVREIRVRGESAGSAPDGRFRVIVSDTGPGVRADKLEAAFLPFNRIASGVRGTGLGLAIVRRFMEKFGGRVWLESDGASGTAALMEFKVAAAEGAALDASKRWVA